MSGPQQAADPKAAASCTQSKWESRRCVGSEGDVDAIVVILIEEIFWRGFGLYLFAADFGDAHENGVLVPLHFEEIDGFKQIDEFLETIGAMVDGTLVVDAAP
jgi:hypothetical protein